MAKLYNTFRMNMTKRIGGGLGFFALTEMKLFSGVNGSGMQLLVGGVATASSSFGAGYEADKGFDSDTSTRWATDGTTNSAWLRYDLEEGIEKPKSIYLLLNNAPENAPLDFILQGSTDNGAHWEDIYTAVNFATSSEFLAGVTKELAQIGLIGSALNFDGTPVNRIIVYDWFTGYYVGTSTPSSNGDWRFVITTALPENRYLVVATGASDLNNLRPQAHGPVSAIKLE